MKIKENLITNNSYKYSSKSNHLKPSMQNNIKLNTFYNKNEFDKL
jgi:hypothetical protein